MRATAARTEPATTIEPGCCRLRGRPLDAMEDLGSLDDVTLIHILLFLFWMSVKSFPQSWTSCD